MLNDKRVDSVERRDAVPRASLELLGRGHRDDVAAHFHHDAFEGGIVGVERRNAFVNGYRTSSEEGAVEIELLDGARGGKVDASTDFRVDRTADQRERDVATRQHRGRDGDRV